MLNRAEVIHRLQELGINPTQQRVSIATCMLAQPQHLAADQVLAMVRSEGANVSKATVYNTLALFARKGLIREVIVDPARVFYDSNTDPHHHIYNVDTGALEDVDAGDFPVPDMPHLPEGTVAEGVDVVIRVRNSA